MISIFLQKKRMFPFVVIDTWLSPIEFPKQFSLTSIKNIFKKEYLSKIYLIKFFV